MELYAAFDLHGNNNFLALIDSNGRRIFGKRLLNDRERILEVLRPYQRDLIGVGLLASEVGHQILDHTCQL